MQLHPKLPSLPIFKSNFSMLSDQTQHCLEYIRFSGDGHISSSVVWAPAALGRVPGSTRVYAFLLSAQILSGNSAAQASQLALVCKASVSELSCCSSFCLGISRCSNSFHREMVVQRIWQRRVKRQRAKKERIKKREEQGGCLVDEPG